MGHDTCMYILMTLEGRRGGKRLVAVSIAASIDATLRGFELLDTVGSSHCLSLDFI